MAKVKIKWLGHDEGWRVRCRKAGLDATGPDFADAVARIDAALGPDAPLRYKANIGEDIDWYLDKVNYYRDNPGLDDELAEAISDSVFEFGMFGVDEPTARRLLRADAAPERPGDTASA